MPHHHQHTDFAIACNGTSRDNSMMRAIVKNNEVDIQIEVPESDSFNLQYIITEIQEAMGRKNIDELSAIVRQAVLETHRLQFLSGLLVGLVVGIFVSLILVKV